MCIPQTTMAVLFLVLAGGCEPTESEDDVTESDASPLDDTVSDPGSDSDETPATDEESDAGEETPEPLDTGFDAEEDEDEEDADEETPDSVDSGFDTEEDAEDVTTEGDEEPEGIEDVPAEELPRKRLEISTVRVTDDGTSEIVCDEIFPFISEVQPDYWWSGPDGFHTDSRAYIGGCETCDWKLRMEGPSQEEIEAACGPDVYSTQVESWAFSGDALAHFLTSWDRDHPVYAPDGGPGLGKLTVTSEEVRLPIPGTAYSSVYPYSEYYAAFTVPHAESARFDIDSFTADRKSVEWFGSYVHPDDPSLRTEVRGFVEIDSCLSCSFYGSAYEVPTPEPGDWCNTTFCDYLPEWSDNFEEVVDCSGCCVAEAIADRFVGDSICDDSASSYINLNCPQFDFDGGDCIEEDGDTESASLCTETCFFSSDGDCDDGGADADYDLCDYGTDCTDCGPR